MAGGVMGKAISKNLRWDGSVAVEPHPVDLLRFFAPREGLRVSAAFAGLLPWIVYTHDTVCNRLLADCFDLRRAIRQNRLRHELPSHRAFHAIDGLCLAASLIGEQFGGKPGWLVLDGAVNVFLLDVGGQTLAVSVSCLDAAGELFVDDWWFSVEHCGSLVVHDRVFVSSQAQAAQVASPMTMASAANDDGRSERRRAVRDYGPCGLGGRALRVYLRRHTVKRFCAGYTAAGREVLYGLAANRLGAGYMSAGRH